MTEQIYKNNYGSNIIRVNYTLPTGFSSLCTCTIIDENDDVIIVKSVRNEILTIRKQDIFSMKYAEKHDNAIKNAKRDI